MLKYFLVCDKCEFEEKNPTGSDALSWHSVTVCTTELKIELHFCTKDCRDSFFKNKLNAMNA